MDTQFLERIKNSESLPSLPTIAVQVLDLAQQEKVDIDQIASIISKDPALCVKILRTVNSSFYARSKEVSSISQALVIMGLQSVKTLVLGFSLVSNLFKKKTSRFDHITYWRHSLYHATAARLVAKKLGIVQQEEAFLIGLLADIGMLVMDQVLGDAYGTAIASAASHENVCAAEKTALSMTHADVSAFLTESWGLPPVLCLPIANHHSPAQVSDASLQKLTQVAAYASRCADVYVDADAGSAIGNVRESGKQQFGWELDAVDALLAEIGTRTKEVASLFEIKLGENESFEIVLRRANEALVKIMLQTQQKEVALKQQNESLKQQVFTDVITGLTNRTGFETGSQIIWNEAESKVQVFSVIMIDLDKFKAVNDTHGHIAGDDVLREVGMLLKASVRQQDIAARYGGEEFVLMLPDTPRDMATLVADRIRSSLQTKTIVSENTVIRITASFGVASFEPGGSMRTLQHVIKAADLALYEAKRSGRNKVKVFRPAPPAVVKAA